MTTLIDIPFSVTDRATRSLKAWINASGMKEPIAGIVWAADPDQKKEDWLVGLFEGEKITDDAPGNLLKVADIELFFPQGNFVTDRLSGKALDIIDGKYRIT